MSTVSLVTGGNRGIGREVCRQLAARGHTVILTARSAEAADEAAQPIGATPLPLDVTDAGSVTAARREVEARYGHLDVLVNNAAISYDTWQRAATADLAVVREAAETNLYGPWLMVQEFLPLLRRSAHPRIVNVSSEAGSLAGMGGGTPAYTASKAALNALTRMLAAELRGDGILVNAVCPGWVATDMGGPGGRPVADGAASVVWAAVLPDSGPTGGFFRDGKPLPWLRPVDAQGLATARPPSTGCPPFPPRKPVSHGQCPRSSAYTSWSAVNPGPLSAAATRRCIPGSVTRTISITGPPRNGMTSPGNGASACTTCSATLFSRSTALS